jgi:tetratricopeptide (TPR) repeat protein
MSKPNSSALPRLSPEQRLAAAGQFERANQVLTTGNLEYGMQLLLNCCLIDPANPTYRQALRQAQKAKYKHNLTGQKLAVVTTLRAKVKLKTARQRGDWPKVLEVAEAVLMRNPWDLGTHLTMAEAFEKIGATGMAIWTLDQVRQVDGDNPKINRPLARLFEKTGNFTAATALWEKVRKAVPDDLEAQHKFKDLAASATIAKGRYEDALQGTAPTPLHGQAESKGPNDSADSVIETAMQQTAAQQTQTDLPRAGVTPPGGSAGKADPKVPREVAALVAKIEANPTNPNGYLHLASVFRRADQFDEARRILRAALAPTANSFEIAMELIDLDIEPFRRDLAIAEEKISRQPANSELQALRANLAREIATRELDFFRHKSDRFPAENTHRLEMGVRLLRCGQVDEAIRELQAVRADRRHQGKALVYLGYCFQSRNNWRLAQRNFEEALGQLTPADEKLRKEILYELAKGYAASGDLTRAIDMACELANIDFNYKDIGKLLDDWNANVKA